MRLFVPSEVPMRGLQYVEWERLEYSQIQNEILGCLERLDAQYVDMKMLLRQRDNYRT